MSEQAAVINGRLPVDDMANHYLKQLGVREMDYFLIDPLSIGDAYQTLCLLRVFREKYMQPGARLFYWCQPRVAPLVAMFNVVDMVISSQIDFNVCYMFAQRYQGVAAGRPIVVGPAMYADGWLQRLLDHGLVSTLHVRQLMLGLDLDCPISHPVVADATRQLAAENAQASGVEVGNSLLIVNHATTSVPLPVEAYAGAVASFPGPVFTDMTVGGAQLIPGTRPINIPLDQVIPMGELCGSVLALRSGIVDLLANANARLFSIYPRPEDAQTWVTDRTAWVSAYRNATLTKMGLLGAATETEIFLHEDDGVAEISARVAAALVAG
jgi:hypothetical protein